MRAERERGLRCGVKEGRKEEGLRLTVNLYKLEKQAILNLYCLHQEDENGKMILFVTCDVSFQ